MIKRITVRGAVQGVGYRPFISEKAVKYGLTGSVKNMGASVEILAKGSKESLDAFLYDIENEWPSGAFIIDTDSENFDDITGSSNEKIPDVFEIIESSDEDLSKEIPVFLPDIGICDECLKEMLDAGNRRYRYPLISCTVCGPRISILNKLPYDRHTTTMQEFAMCKSCEGEYRKGRRYYAQTISCHDCGPQILFRFKDGGCEREAIGEEAVRTAADILKRGGIIGLKGISGYQLVCRPESGAAERLRAVKGRENKPFAIMFSEIDTIRGYADISHLEEKLLKSSARPIVLLKKKYDFPEEVVKDSLYIGAFLPSSGIHRLLCDEAGPLIATSANVSDETMLTDDEEFYSKFFKEIDGMCYNKRHINMAQDDSVVFVINDGEQESVQFVRRARGYVPMPLFLDKEIDNEKKEICVCGFGGDLKSTFSFGKGDRILLSQHIGDLEDESTHRNFRFLYDEYQRIFSLKPNVLVSDMHPGYFSSKVSDEIAEKLGIPNLKLQHHFAHIYSVMAENSLLSAIGLAFDGTGNGTDGNSWGGEFLYCSKAEITREGHISTIKLVGGDAASRNAADVCRCYRLQSAARETVNEKENEDARYDILSKALLKNINTFGCSSMGRLFDSISALLGIKETNSYEGECAIALENEAVRFINSDGTDPDYPKFDIKVCLEEGHIIADQLDLFSEIEQCQRSGNYSVGAISYGFHMALCRMVRDICRIIREKRSENKVCLSGGTFNNRILLENVIRILRADGFEVFWNRKVPTGDGGISAGQAYYGLLKSMEG